MFLEILKMIFEQIIIIIVIIILDIYYRTAIAQR